MTAAQTLSNPVTGLEVADAFKAIGVESGFRAPDLYRIGTLLLGWSGSGKTTFAASIRDSLMLYFTPEKAGAIVAPRAHRIYFPVHETYAKVMAVLYESKAAGTCPYRLVSIDTGDEWFHVIAGGVMATYNALPSRKKEIAAGRATPAEMIGEVGQKGKGFDRVAELMEGEIRQLQEHGFGWLATGHLQKKNITTMMPDGRTVDVEVIRPVLTSSSFKRLVRLAFLRAEIGIKVRTTGPKTMTGKDGKSYTVKDGKLDTPIREHYLRLRTSNGQDEVKSYLPQIPDVIPFPRHAAWDALDQTSQVAIAAATSEDAELRGAT